MGNSEKIFQNFIGGVVNPIFGFSVMLITLYFLWGVLKYIINLDKPDEREIARRHMIWGLVGLFIIFSIGGILGLLSSTLGGMFQ
jgi:hypothetical protein